MIISKKIYQFLNEIDNTRIRFPKHLIFNYLSIGFQGTFPEVSATKICCKKFLLFFNPYES